MTPDEINAARHKLGLTLAQMGLMLGYESASRKNTMYRITTGERKLLPAQRRLLEAYLRGDRPDDWPVSED